MSPSQKAPAGSFFANWLRNTLKILHRLWLEVTGFIFCAFALFGVMSLLRELKRQQGGEGEMWKLVAAGTFTATMLMFGVYSFFKSHRIK